MSKRDSEVYWWIKFKKDFFRSNEMKLIRCMENGAEYILFWQQLLFLATDNVDVGLIRYKETMPYTDKMLATVTDTNIDIVRTALKIFQQMGWLEVKENGDLWIEQAKEITGGETYGAERKRLYRQQQIALDNNKNGTMSPECPINVPVFVHQSIEYRVKSNIIPAECFPTLWEKYPKKLGRKDAFRHFKGSIKTQEDIDMINKALDNYLNHIKQNKIEQRYIQHGSTWFNNWRDWIDVVSQDTGKISIEGLI
jgi:predicted phage replisome organizer